MKKKYNILFFTIGLCIFLYFIFSFGIQNLITNIRTTGFWLIPIIIVWLFIYLFNTSAWLLIVRKYGSKISFLKLFSIHLSSSAINYVTPLINLGGEPYRMLSASEYMDNDVSVSSTLLFNFLHIISHLFFWFLCATMILFMFDKIILKLFSVILLIVLGVIIFIILYGQKNGVFGFLFRIVNKFIFPERIKSFFLKRKDKFDNIDRLVADFYINERKIYIKAFLIELAARFISGFEFYFILTSIGVNITIFQSIYIYAASSLILNILFFIPMETGTREASLYWIAGSLNMVPGIGIYISVVNRIREFFWIFVGLILMRFNNNKLNSGAEMQ
ncbi:MAG TPA: lysylphosphatidylglycerol synthase transmembrane domain-containing protein [Ignavibacteria bacterium]|nr:lysylphosphatidylglycerol synthase transmembrane domain-containing protein [Ignavibacteria bacterium]